MRARTHILLTYLLTVPLLGVERAITVSLSTILPDLDHPNSLVSSVLYPLELLTGRDVRLAISRRLRHRGVLHCPWPWGALAYLLWSTGHPNAALVLLGGFLHCLEDAFTTMGVPVLWRYEGGSWRSVRLSLTGLPSDAWDGIILPLALAVTWALFLLNPAEFHAIGLDGNPYLERLYWDSRAVFLRPFLHSVEGLNREALRVSGYGRLPHVRVVLRYVYGSREVSGLWTPVGWVRGDDGRWYPPPTYGYSLRSLSYVRAGYRVGTVRCRGIPDGALVLRAVLVYEGLDPVSLGRLVRRAVLLGFRVRHVDRVGGHVVLEGEGLAVPVLRRLPGPVWCRVTFCPGRIVTELVTVLEWVLPGFGLPGVSVRNPGACGWPREEGTAGGDHWPSSRSRRYRDTVTDPHALPNVACGADRSSRTFTTTTPGTRRRSGWKSPGNR